MEFVFLPISSTTLCGFVAGNLKLKIRDTSNTEVLIKGCLAMLRIVNCAYQDLWSLISKALAHFSA